MAALLSRTRVDTMTNLLAGLGIEIETKRREEVGVTLWCSIKKIPVPDFKPGPPYSRAPIRDLQKDIYERIVGDGVAEEVLRILPFTMSKDALVALQLLLDGKDISNTKFPAMTVLRASGQAISITQHMQQIVQAGVPRSLSSNTRNHSLNIQWPNNRALPKFEKLPTELRLCIWELVISTGPGRIMQLHNYKGAVKSTCRPPVTAHICQESRRVTMKAYTRPFNLMYFHPSLDTLYIGSRTIIFDLKGIEWLFDTFPSTFTITVTKVALGTSDMIAMENALKQVSLFPNLKTLSWVIGEELHWSAHRVEFRPVGAAVVCKALIDVARVQINKADRAKGMVRDVEITQVAAEFWRR